MGRTRAGAGSRAPARLHLPGPASAARAPGPALQVLVAGGGPPRTACAVVAAGVGSDRRVAGLGRVRLHGLDDRSLQLTWGSSPPGTVAVGAGRLVVEAPGGGPGAVVIDGLAPGRTVPLWVATAAGRAPLGPVTPLPRPPGRLLAQVATVTDLHVGERHFGPPWQEDRWPLGDRRPYTLRALAAALAEAVAWGATHVVAKGDLTADSEPAQVEAVGELLATCGAATDVVLGNHDVRHGIDVAGPLARRGIGATTTVRHRDLPGLRLVLCHSPSPTDHWGEMADDDLDAVGRLAAAAPGGTMVVLHHPPAAGPVALHHPPGLRPASASGLLRRLSAATPRALVVAGHTHRHRLRWPGDVPVVETGSTKDHPGGWTGYRVFEGGVVQTARRTADPDVLEWTERTAGALLGRWGRWSPGVLADRAFSLEWGR